MLALVDNEKEKLHRLIELCKPIHWTEYINLCNFATEKFKVLDVDVDLAIVMANDEAHWRSKRRKLINNSNQPPASTASVELLKDENKSSVNVNDNDNEDDDVVIIDTIRKDTSN